MATFIQKLQHILNRQGKREEEVLQVAGATRARHMEAPPLTIAPNDPIVAYFLSAPGPVEVDKLHLNSPTLHALQSAGVRMVVPMITQGELVGLLNLGPRLSEQDYSTDDRGLLNTLATQAAPAIRVAQLVREQHAQTRERERLEQELRVARLIQQTLLPKELPALPGWHFSAYYQPARAVGGDFYDFLTFADGRLGIVIGDVTDKGVPAALVMATTRSILRSVAQGEASPGKVLEQTNNLLCPDIPPKMFVTCLYAILDPRSGQLRYANAGHDLPYQQYNGGVSELYATGMPLGLMPDMLYEEKETTLAYGESVLFYSDGLVEAHNAAREMFSFPRLAALLGEQPKGGALIDFLLGELAQFTGASWEQEDDVTLVTLQRSPQPGSGEIATRSANCADETVSNDGWRTLAEWNVASEPGNERRSVEQVAEVIQVLNIPTRRLEELKTAVAEATMNAMEHGNHYQPDLPVSIQVLASDTAFAVRISDQGCNQLNPAPELPDLEAKLAERQTPYGWGLFLMKELVDEMRITSDGTHHTVELIMYLERENHANHMS